MSNNSTKIYISAPQLVDKINAFFFKATFCGSTMGKKKGYHFSMADFEALGYHFCDTLLDYCDPDNTKVRTTCPVYLQTSFNKIK